MILILISISYKSHMGVLNQFATILFLDVITWEKNKKNMLKNFPM
jgi:hypothetical protein